MSKFVSNMMALSGCCLLLRVFLISLSLSYSECLCVHLLDKWIHAVNRPVNHSVRCGWIHPQVSHSILNTITTCVCVCVCIKFTSLSTAAHVCHPSFVCICVLRSGLGSWGRWWTTSYGSSVTMTRHRGKATTLTGCCVTLSALNHMYQCDKALHSLSALLICPSTVTLMSMLAQWTPPSSWNISLTSLPTQTSCWWKTWVWKSAREATCWWWGTQAPARRRCWGSSTVCGRHTVVRAERLETAEWKVLMQFWELLWQRVQSSWWNICKHRKMEWEASIHDSLCKGFLMWRAEFCLHLKNVQILHKIIVKPLWVVYTSVASWQFCPCCCCGVPQVLSKWPHASGPEGPSSCLRDHTWLMGHCGNRWLCFSCPFTWHCFFL